MTPHLLATAVMLAAAPPEQPIEKVGCAPSGHAFADFTMKSWDGGRP